MHLIFLFIYHILSSGCARPCTQCRGEADDCVRDEESLVGNRHADTGSVIPQLIQGGIVQNVLRTLKRSLLHHLEISAGTSQEKQCLN